MKINRKLLLGSTAFATAFAIAAPGVAQDAPPPSGDDATTVEEIVITGSLIRRDPANAPTPLIQVGRDDILETGQTTVIDYLATIPALSNSLVPSDTTGSGLNDGGLEFANLRSLGTGRTLTLVDGRRHVGSSAGSLSVDVSTIPRLLIENIEIVTGGASSIYGADAVSGVINFILRDDFEGLEIDANYGMINSEGEATRRVSALLGQNFMDDRLNVYVHGEYELTDEVTSLDIPWIANAPFVLGVDADPTAVPSDGIIDSALFTGVVRMDRPRWGQTTLFGGQRASDLNNPNVPYDGGACAGASISSLCYAVTPGQTFWYEGGGARLADFGTRVGNTGISRPFNIGGDGVNPSDFSTSSRLPEQESARFQAGLNFAVTPNVDFFFEAKYVTEDSDDVAQPTFFDINLLDITYGPTSAPVLRGVQAFDLRWSDNAFLPQNVKDAIAANTAEVWGPPTQGGDSQLLGVIAAPFARHVMFGPERAQNNTREVTRFVTGFEGRIDSLAFVDNINWDIGYTYGEMQNVNTEIAVDSQRFQWQADAVVDTAGVVGAAGEIVCRIQVIDALGLPLTDFVRGGDIRDTEYGRNSIDECVPLNVFGAGNQTDEALAYSAAEINVRQTNEQHQALARIGGQLWDFWGAGPIGVALGYEYRKEYTEGIGRSADTAGRFLFLNTGPDFLGAEYESNEGFAELSIPLLRDSVLGEYAELSGSYRYSDYTTVGEVDVYGVNLIYRPIRDITFRSSFNTAVRVPNLGENFSPATQTFFNAVNDPCATAAINNPANAEFRDNRIQNCTALAAQQGLSFDFAGNTATNTDDFVPVYGSGVAGVNAGNPFLEPEESESFTFSVVLQPRFIPNLSVILDYYDIEVENVIATVSAQTAANNCVNGPSLNAAACNTIFRNDPTPGREFYIGAPQGDPIGGFIQGSINYAALKTEGIDFTVNYALDTYDWLGRDWGRFSYSMTGLWLLKQEQYTNADDPTDVTILGGRLFYPRVRLTSSLTYAPNDAWSVNWTADWQTSQPMVLPSSFIVNEDSRPASELETGDFTRHDFTVRWNVNDDIALRAGVVNAFDNNQHPWLGTTLYSNFDPYGRRFFVGLNYRLW
ncbi:MAG: outer membrane receptor protein involved in Fe transport [Brevundimonas sp.]|jgi:outer membrane receptor protein involved in Fe transport|uniref:TonB-dependent receptor domain-containing protein n=1 Tax=Brevundimonas sp. TaxID=1871086 RepID=UPI0039E4B077